MAKKKRAPKQGTEAFERQQVMGLLTEPAAKLAEKWSREQDKLDVNDLTIWLKHAREAHAVKMQPDKYGDDALNLISQALGWHKSYVSHMLAVIEHVSPKTLDRVKELNAARGDDPTRGLIRKSHLIKLASIGDEDLHLALVKQIHDEGLTVSTFEAKIEDVKETNEDLGGRSASTQPPRPSYIANSVANAANKLLEMAAPVGTDAFMRGVDGIVDYPNGIAKIRKAIDALKEVETVVPERLETLEDAYDRLVAAQEASLTDEGEEEAVAPPKRVAKKKKSKKRKPADSDSVMSAAVEAAGPMDDELESYEQESQEDRPRRAVKKKKKVVKKRSAVAAEAPPEPRRVKKKVRRKVRKKVSAAGA